MGRVLLDVVQDVVVAHAPEELPLVVGLSRFDDAEIARRLARAAKNDEPLGFGGVEVVALVTSIVWTAVQATANEMVGAAASGMVTQVRAALRRVFRRKPPSAPLPHFGQRELAEVHRRVLELARESGMDPDRAALLADGVVGQLAMGSGSAA